MPDLPYAADAELSLTYDELEVLRLQYHKEEAAGHITVQTKFNYAWGLVKSPKSVHQELGVKILQGETSMPSLSIGPPSLGRAALEKKMLTQEIDIYRSEANRRRECLYYIALGYYKMGDYTNAQKFNGEGRISDTLFPFSSNSLRSPSPRQGA